MKKNLLKEPEIIKIPKTNKFIEYSVHTCPTLLKYDLVKVFPNVNLDNLLIIPTFQKVLLLFIEV
jgi:hypothetical protein